MRAPSECGNYSAASRDRASRRMRGRGDYLPEMTWRLSWPPGRPRVLVVDAWLARSEHGARPYHEFMTAPYDPATAYIAARVIDEERLPPRVVSRLDESVLSLLRDRLAQHTLDFYAGIPIEKFPEDLRVYEHPLWWTRPEAVVEVGTSSGGSALWFRDRLRTLERYGRIADPLVVSTDIDMTRAREWLGVEPQGIVHLEIDCRSPELTSQVAHALGGRTRCLVIEDSAHVYDTTRASLDHLSKFVDVGGLVVEDAVVDEEALRIDSR